MKVRLKKTSALSRNLFMISLQNAHVSYLAEYETEYVRNFLKEWNTVNMLDSSLCSRDCFAH